MKIRTNPDLDPKLQARNLYWQGYRLRRISEMLDIPESTISTWKKSEQWDKVKPLDRVEANLEARLITLINKDQKEGKDFKEIDLLMRQQERMARVHKYNGSGNEVDLNPNIANRNKGPRKKPERNAIDDDQQSKLVESFHETMFDYQKGWYQAGLKHRIRNILKSRQIGATFYFAHEAFIDALETGRNQIFLSASKAQAHVFRQYIVQFVKDTVGVELRGDPIVLPNGAHLYFLGTNARTAQSYHGNLYLDEYFWIHKFQEFRKVASGMALHKKWRQTYFSTPSSLEHDAYPFWSGDHFNRGRAKADKIQLDLSHANLVDGKKCDDGHWRQIITVEDAVKGGCDLFDLDQLKLEYSPDEYQNLLMCQFIDDTSSVFSMPMMQRCMVDSWEVWEDFKPLAGRPLANREVWIGYDPAKGGIGDSAGCAVIAPPVTEGGKFRVLEKYQWRGKDFKAQADAIREITKRYRVTYIGIDITGIGEGVFQLVKQFFPQATPFQYSPVVKGRLVMKGHDVISKGRLEFDAGSTDIAQSFISIRKSVTASGRAPTYEAGRSKEASHADLAWAIMHALHNEPLEGSSGSKSGFMELYD
ncbi:terminase ATPase subunit family protein [Idiomarina sp.]|uniref:terminase ATPase subunit family protein n=1 Tax=Idiomarina sp. TaxID=1874361 RepID=UPI001D74A30B|nr:terminase ATPase subunit family protein [Idiomarina sp.]MCJ8317010.1 terminase ATPase subunit family protein [Idiomarina sp.]NQZ17369.1 terminase ATPase subunit family protein [Idiomarina sp.]